MPRTQHHLDPNEAFTYPNRPLSNYDEIEAFRTRQQEDLLRRQNQSEIRLRKPFHRRQGSSPGPGLDYSNVEDDKDVDESTSESGEEGWQDSGGNRLKDYGVDEVIEFYDEDDIPISELLRRRKARKV
jgi:palmitoyltransferase